MIMLNRSKSFGLETNMNMVSDLIG